MSLTTLNKYANGQSALLRMYDREGNAERSAPKIGNIRLINQKKTIGEVTFSISREEMIIDGLFVKPQFRRRGFGTQLLRLAENIAAETSLRHISLKPSPIDTVKMATLKSWYSHRGYSPYSRNLMHKTKASILY